MSFTTTATPIASISSLDGSIDNLIILLDTDAYSAGSLFRPRLRVCSSGAASSASSLSTSVTSLNTAVSNLQTSVADLTSGTTAVYVQDNAPTGTIVNESLV